MNGQGGTAAGRAFPATQHSVVEGLSSTEPAVRARAHELLVRAYWRPVYATLRLGHGYQPDDAADLTQEFFLHSLEKHTLAGFDPARARFRTWVRTCLRGFVGHARQAEARLKRGGGLRAVPWDAAELEADLAAAPGEDPFDREWARGIIALALGELESRCRAGGQSVRWEVFRRYDIEWAERERRPTYAELAESMGLPTSQVTNHLHWARRAFRQGILDALRAVTATDDEFRAEAQALLGDAP